MPVFEQDDLPDFICGQVLFPRWHNGCPRESFIRKTNSSLSDAPEDKCFLELRNRPRVGKVRRNRIERERVKSTAVQVVTVAEVTVLKEDFSTFTNLLQVAFSLLIPGVRVGGHQAAHSLLHDQFVTVGLIVLPFEIDTVRIL